MNTPNKKPDISTLVYQIKSDVKDAQFELCPYTKTDHRKLHEILLRIAKNANQAIVENSIYLGK